MGANRAECPAVRLAGISFGARATWDASDEIFIKFQHQRQNRSHGVKKISHERAKGAMLLKVPLPVSVDHQDTQTSSVFVTLHAAYNCRTHHRLIVTCLICPDVLPSSLTSDGFVTCKPELDHRGSLRRLEWEQGIKEGIRLDESCQCSGDCLTRRGLRDYSILQHETGREHSVKV